MRRRATPARIPIAGVWFNWMKAPTSVASFWVSISLARIQSQSVNGSRSSSRINAKKRERGPLSPSVSNKGLIERNWGYPE
jgi:hypothetical protein